MPPKKYKKPETGNNSRYRKGVNKEGIIVSIAKRNGFNTIQSERSRGPYDVFAEKCGKKYCIQVKTTERVGIKPYISKKETNNLIKSSKKIGAIPAIARIDAGSHVRINNAITNKMENMRK